jgi:hypothetical protein
MTRTTTCSLLARAAALIGTLALLPPLPAHAASTWIRQFGSTDREGGAGVAIDFEGNVYVTGETWGSLAAPSLGGTDAFIAKFDPAGENLWMSQFGTSDHDSANDIATGELGSFYITGRTYGNLAGPKTGWDDGYVSRFDSAGNPEWVRQFGDVYFKETFAEAVAADALGNVYAVGGFISPPDEFEGYISKYDAAGSLLWTRRPVGNDASGVSLDAVGNVYVTGGTTTDAFVTSESFVAKYDLDGNLQWTTLLDGVAGERIGSIAADTLGNVYVGGSIWGPGGPSADDADAFLAKYDADGNLQWTEQLGTSAEEGCSGLAVDSLGNAYIAGFTRGSLARPGSGDSDAFIAKYDAAGALQAIRQFGTASADGCADIQVDQWDNVYVTGYTYGELGGPLLGPRDAFLARLPASLVPEPASWVLVLSATWMGSTRAHNRRVQVPSRRPFAVGHFAITYHMEQRRPSR